MEPNNRQSRDAEVEALLAAAVLPLLRFPCRRSYDTREIAGQVLPLLNPGAADNG